MMRSAVIYIEIHLLTLIFLWAKGQPVKEVSESSEKLKRNDFSASTKLPEIIYTTPRSISSLYEKNDIRGKKYQSFGDTGTSKLDFKRGIIGIADIDYPAYSEIPNTSFSCHAKLPGYYADEETRCQVFHVCYSSTSTIKQSFLCPNGTVFSQELTTCEWWTKVNCKESKRYYYSDKYEQDLQVSQSITRGVIAIPRTTESSLTGNKVRNKTSNAKHNNNNFIKIINFNDNSTKEHIFNDEAEFNITNHQSDDIQLILDNLFADFQDNKGTKPVKYTEDYILQKMYNTNLSVKYENQKNLQDINDTIDYSFLLYDSPYSDNRTTTVPVDSFNLSFDHIYDYENITKEITDHDLFENLKIVKKLQNQTIGLEELLNQSKSLNSTIVRTNKNSDLNKDSEGKSTKNRSKNNFKSPEIPFVSQLMRYSKISTSNHDDENSDESDDNDDDYDDILDTTTYSVLDLLKNTEPTVYETLTTSDFDSKEKISRRQPLLSEFLNSNDNHTEEILNSQLLAEFHTISKNNNFKNGNNEKFLKNNSTYLNNTIKERNSSKSENQMKRILPEKTVVESYHEQLYNVPSLNLTDIQNRKLQSFIQDQTINTFFNYNNPQHHQFLNLFDLKESGDTNGDITVTPITFTTEQKEIKITPRPPYKTTTLSDKFSTNKYSLNMDGLLTINTELDNPIHHTKIVYKNNPDHSLLEGFDTTTTNSNIQKSNNYYINDSNTGLLKRDKPALTLADIFNINKLQAFYNYNNNKDSQSQIVSTEKNFDSTEPEFSLDKQEVYKKLPPTPETIIYRSLGFSLDTEDDVKAFSDAISAGLIGET